VKTPLEKKINQLAKADRFRDGKWMDAGKQKKKG